MSSRKTELAPTTTVVNRDPWSEQQPHLKEAFSRARTFLDQPLQYYPNSTVVPFAPQTEEALGLAEARARAGSPLTRAARDEATATLRGDYLAQGNPYLENAIGAASRPVVENYIRAVSPGLDARFSSSGRYGSGMHALAQQGAQETLGRSLSDMVGSLAYQNYRAERDSLARAATLAPQLAAADYVDFGQLERIGQERESQANAELQDAINRYMHAQAAPRDALREFMALVGGGTYGGSETTTGVTPIQRDSVQDTLGVLARFLPR